MTQPELAVVVLSVGAPAELRTAVESLLGQTEALEIVVVNSGGGDASAVLPNGINVINIPELLWPGAARNVGINATRAPWVAFLASDLIAAPDWATQRLALHRGGRKSVASAIGNGQRGNLFAWASHAALHVRRMPGIAKRKAHRYGASYARGLFEHYGLFREDLRIGEDTEFHRRMRRRDRPTWAPKVVASHHYPTSLAGMVADQLARGERAAVHWPTIQPGSLLRRGLRRFRDTAPLAVRSASRGDRWRVLAASPLLLVCAFAYEAGVSRGRLKRIGSSQDATLYPVVVAILDRDEWNANTDVIVIVDPVLRQLMWVPRDLWVPSLRDRINAAFSIGGGEKLLAALSESRLRAEGVLCIRRGATELALDTVTITVPVRESMQFWYPLAPTLPIEAGRRVVAFHPPHETLSGERLHQWIGARTRVHGPGSDLDRIERQQVLVRELMAAGFDFAEVLRQPSLYRVAGKDPLSMLGKVRPDWHCSVFDSVQDAHLDGKAVLVRL